LREISVLLFLPVNNVILDWFFFGDDEELRFLADAGAIGARY
jgi:hypothetical protein